MKTRIRVAFTVDLPDSKIKELCRGLKFQFKDFEPEGTVLHTEDVHVVAQRNHEVIVNLGNSPVEYP